LFEFEHLERGVHSMSGESVELLF